MKLLGYTNGQQVIASIAAHDFRTFGSGDSYIMADGGVIGITSNGYNRHWGRPIWIEVPQNMAELYNDYNQSLFSPRKYGVWQIEDVKVLAPEEYPDTNGFEYRAENEIWGTNGPNGDEPTTHVLIKDCSKEHLAKISELCGKRGNKKLQEIADYWIDKKAANDYN